MRSHGLLPRSVSRSLAAVATIVLALVASGASAQVLDERLWIPNGSISSLARSGNILYVAGSFNRLDPPDGGPGVARAGLAAIDVTTGAPTAWNPNVGYGVQVIAVAGSRVYVGGTIYPRYVAAIDAETGATTSWDPHIYPGGLEYKQVASLAVAGSNVYVGGYYQLQNVGSCHGLVAFDAVSAAPNWCGNPNEIVLDLAVDESTVYAGGDFSVIAGASRPDLAGLNRYGGGDSGWDPGGTNLIVRALALHAGTLYAGGEFSVAGHQPRANLAAFDAVTGAVTAWNPGADGEVQDIAASGGSVFVCGAFTHVGGQSRARLAAFDAATGAVSPIDFQVTGARVDRLLVSGDVLYVAGDFTEILGTPRARLAAITGVVAGVGSGPAITGALRIAPNPSRGEVRLSVAMPRAGSAEVGIFDLGGRCVRRLHRGELMAGARTFAWDGRDDRGRLSGAGVYLARITGPELNATAKVFRYR